MQSATLIFELATVQGRPSGRPYTPNETGFYYLQSRYYDPAIGRFINADVFASTGQGFLGYNMFAYCGNNPILYLDSSGTSSAVCFSEFTNPITPPFSEAGGGGGLSDAMATLCCLVGVAAILNSKPLPQTKEKELVVSAKNPSPDDVYSVYFLYDINGSKNVIVYVGRVKTANYYSRMAYHLSKGRVPAGTIHGLSYSACRAIEQAGMIILHTLNPGNPINNQIRGISPTNKKRYDYLAAAFDLVNSDLYPDFPILPASYWSNFAENEYLNMGL